jgi:guanyl-specific ribonuclease Sa
MTGQNFGEAFINSFDGIGKSMAIGGAIGVATTIGMSYANGINPWTGKELQVTPKDLKIQSTLDRIKRGESFPHRNDGSVFRNREGFIPSLKNGDYIEYVHPTSGITGAGQQRIVISPDGHIYYTPNHYKIFLKIKDCGTSFHASSLT